MSDPIAALRAAVLAAVERVVPGAELEPTLERPPKADFGDYSTNAAMLLAPLAGAEAARRSPTGSAPRSQAELGDSLERVDVAGPGFLNLFLADEWFGCRRGRDRRGGRALGLRRRRRARAPAQVEFVSANPTGPLTAASAPPRGLRRLARAGSSSSPGHQVEREYYVNDAGAPDRPVRRLASPRGRRAARLPRTATRASTSRARRRLAGEGLDAADTDGAGAARRRADGRADPRDARRASASTSTAGSPSAACTRRPAPGQERHRRVSDASLTYDERRRHVAAHDRARRRQGPRAASAPNGEPTYFAADIAYHRDKLERGFDASDRRARGRPPRLHRPHAGRRSRRSATTPTRLEVVIMQLVNLVEGGEQALDVQARAATSSTLDELIDDDRRRRGPLLPAPALARHARSTSTSTSRRSSRPRTRSTTSSTRTRGSATSSAARSSRRRHPTRRIRRRRRGRRDRPTPRPSPMTAPCIPPKRRSSCGCSSCPPRSSAPSSAASRTRSVPGRARSPPTSTPSTATARC